MTESSMWPRPRSHCERTQSCISNILRITCTLRCAVSCTTKGLSSAIQVAWQTQRVSHLGRSKGSSTDCGATSSRMCSRRLRCQACMREPPCRVSRPHHKSKQRRCGAVIALASSAVTVAGAVGGHSENLMQRRARAQCTAAGPRVQRGHSDRPAARGCFQLVKRWQDRKRHEAWCCVKKGRRVPQERTNICRAGHTVARKRKDTLNHMQATNCLKIDSGTGLGIEGDRGLLLQPSACSSRHAHEGRIW
mgnify:CR=1 FL=1